MNDYYWEIILKFLFFFYISIENNRYQDISILHEFENKFHLKTIKPRKSYFVQRPLSLVVYIVFLR